jgi:hypothetical protein
VQGGTAMRVLGWGGPFSSDDDDDDDVGHVLTTTGSLPPCHTADTSGGGGDDIGSGSSGGDGNGDYDGVRSRPLVLYSDSPLVLLPLPDFSMPYNVITLVGRCRQYDRFPTYHTTHKLYHTSTVALQHMYYVPCPALLCYIAILYSSLLYFTPLRSTHSFYSALFCCTFAMVHFAVLCFALLCIEL